MTKELSRIGMCSASGRSATPVLQSVQASGRLDDLLFGLTVRQCYRNTTADTLEVVYTFPLPLDAVLLALHVELGGKRLAGAVVEKKDAQRQYEQAMAEGDAPIMLERSGDGLCTVNLGNIKAGEDAVIEYRYAQLLRFEQDRVRLCIPTTIAPRYGDALKGGKLQPHQVPEASLAAQYGLSLALELNGAWAQAEVGCATHACSMKPVDGGLRLALGNNAWLDRDVVVTLRPQGMASVAQQVGDGGQRVVLASYLSSLQATPRAQINVKLLVDCSGSMAGESMASAKLALTQVVTQLRERDCFSFSRFGSDVRHGFRRLAPARPANLAMLQALIEETQANLGGTEMQRAMTSTIALQCAADSADILLITDGEVWEVDAMVEAAAASKHRVFAVGVGSAPAESLLRRLAEATGGACEFATPGESLRAAVDRMFARIRQQAVNDLQLEWEGVSGPVQADWMAGLPRTVFAGDTVHVFAGFSEAQPVRARLTGGGVGGERELLASTEVCARSHADDSLQRMAAAARLGGAPKEQALALALQYQLVTEHTNFLVIHQRAEEDKALDMAQLHQVPSMLAAGWGGVGVAAAKAAPAPAAPPAGSRLQMLVAAPAAGSDMMTRGGAPQERSRGISLGSRLAAFKLRKSAPAQAAQPVARLDGNAILQIALSALASAVDVELDKVLDPLNASQEVVQCMDALVASGFDRKTAWAVLIRWLAEQSAQLLATEVELALEKRLGGVTAEQWREALGALERLAAQA